MANRQFKSLDYYWKLQQRRAERRRPPTLLGRIGHWFICGTKDNKFLRQVDPHKELWGFAMECRRCGRYHEFVYPMRGA